MEDLSLKCFKRLHLTEDNKKIRKGLHPPVDGKMPWRHIRALKGNSGGDGGGDLSLSIEKL